MTIDFERLLDPYRENNRTIGGQIEWLQKNHQIPEHAVDMAMIRVYQEVIDGKKFKNGNELDQYLLKTAQEIHRQELADQMIKRIEDVSYQLERDRTGRTKFQRIMAILRES